MTTMLETYFSYNSIMPPIIEMDDEPVFDEGIIIIVSSKEKNHFIIV
jgi:hypothetical protein